MTTVELLAHSRQVRRARVVVASGALVLALAAAFAVSLTLGDLHLSLIDVVRGLTGNGDRATEFVLNRLRLPRALCAVAVGAALGVSGSIFQTVTRNGLASPDIIGINAGAGCAAAVAMITFGLTGPVVGLIAIAGALATGAAMYGLAWHDGVSGYRLVLIGVGVSAFATSLTLYVLTTRPALETQRTLFWLSGSLALAQWPEVRLGLIALVVLAVAGPLLARRMRALELGDDSAAGLGLRPEPARLAALLVATVLAALAVSIAGPVTFVALVAAPVARRLTHRAGYLHWPAALVGALVVLLADLTGAHLLGSIHVPVGVLTAVIGAPYLLWLIARPTARSNG